MENPAPEPTPALTIQELLHINRECQAACNELIEMIEIGGDIRDIWKEPRKYFVAEIGSGLPFPNDRAWDPVWRVLDSLPDPFVPLYPADPLARSLVEDIIFGSQSWEFLRREYIPEKFYS